MSNDRHLSRSQRRNRRGRSILALFVALVVLGGAGTAFAFWTASAIGNGNSKGDTLATGAVPNAPTKNAPNGTQVTVTFAQVSTTGLAPIPASNYTIKRYPAAGGSGVTSSASCSGTTTISCVISPESQGQWKYTDTPFYGTQWVGTESGLSAAVTVDTTAPTVSTVIGQATGAVIDGFIKKSTGYFVYANVTDSGAGVQSVTANANNITTTQTAVPLVAGSFTSPAGTSFNYRSAQLTSNNQADGAVLYTVNATDTVGNVSANSGNGTATFDTTGPTVPTPTVTAAYYTTASVPVSLGSVTDAGAGVNAGTVVLQRDQIALSGNACGTFPGTFATTVTLVSGNDTSVVSGFCYRYRQQASDKVGNSTTSGTSNTAQVDTTAPSVPTLVNSAMTNVFTSGSNVYFRSTATSGTFTATASSSDTESGVATYSFPSLGTGWSVSGSGAARTYGWSSANPTTNAGPFTVTATNNAGLTSSGSNSSNPFSLVADNTAPTPVSATVADAVANVSTFMHQGGSYFIFGNASDGTGSGVQSVAANVSTLSGSTGGVCKDLTNTTIACTSVPLTTTGGPWTVTNSNGVGTTTYAYRSSAQTANTTLTAGAKTPTVTATDNVGNATSAQNFNATVDNTAPTVSAFTSANVGATPGLAQVNDTVTATFSETMVNTATASQTMAVCNRNACTPNIASGSSKIIIPGLTSASGFVVATAYVGNNSSFSAGGTLGFSGDLKSVIYTINSVTGTPTTGSSASFTYTPSTTLVDFAGNAVSGTITVTIQLF